MSPVAWAAASVWQELQPALMNIFRPAAVEDPEPPPVLVLEVLAEVLGSVEVAVAPADVAADDVTPDELVAVEPPPPPDDEPQAAAELAAPIASIVAATRRRAGRGHDLIRRDPTRRPPPMAQSAPASRRVFSTAISRISCSLNPASRKRSAISARPSSTGGLNT
jgi:hypothetical protein